MASVQETLRKYSGNERYVDPVDWLMGEDFAHLKPGRGGVRTANLLLRWNAYSKRPLSSKLLSNRRQAVVKIVRNGGTNTADGFLQQFRYLSRDGKVTVQRSESLFGIELDEAGIEDLIDAWGLKEDSRSKSDITSHFVVSFPKGTNRKAAERAGRAWAEELFDSGNYGDVHDYYTVAHHDTDYPHVHVVINRRGLVNDEWLKISKRSMIDYQVMRDVQVEVAEREGIYLDATPRNARGETERPYTDVEVKRAKREGREPVRPDHTDFTAMKSAVNIAYYARQIEEEARSIDKQYPDLAKAMLALSDSFRNGQNVRDLMKSEEVFSVDETKKITHALEEGCMFPVSDHKTDLLFCLRRISGSS